MEKNAFSSGDVPNGQRPSLAEEQRRDFEEDQRRLKRAAHLRWPGFLFRN